jgi:hypothetical protein
VLRSASLGVQHRIVGGRLRSPGAGDGLESNGIGLAESRLWDRHGRLGRAVQSLLIDRF